MEQLKKAIRKNVAGKRITDQFYVDGDVNVPDAKNDIGRIVYSRGMLRIDDMKPVDNYIRVTGKILYQILYVIDGEGQRMSALQGKFPFEEMVYAEEEPKGSVLLKEGSVELSVSLIHSRKVSLKAMVEMELSSENEEEEILTLDVEEEPGLYRRWEPSEVLKLHSVKKDTYRIKEEFVLPNTKETIGNVLISEVSQRKLDTRLGTDELLIRGEIVVFILYESVDGRTDWVEQAIPYEGKMECYGAEDTMYHHLTGGLTDENIDVRMDEDGEMRVVGVEVTLEMRAAIYSEEKLNILKDIYSLKQTVKPAFEEVEAAGLVMQNYSKYKLSEQLSIPELRSEILQVCHTDGKFKLEHTEIVSDGIMAEGVLHICFLYIKADDEAPFEVWQGMVPFTHVIECNGITADMEYDISVVLEQVNVGILGNGEAEVKASAGFQVFLRRTQRIQNIREIETEPLDLEQLSKTPGIVGYIVKEGDELWDLAKRYHTTTEGIKSINQMEGDSLKPGEKMLILGENMSIL
ncbi:MAG: DUF3794 domain-containing protein [Dorea sp.]|nr:DUF3794 domain-containing protein [Dorea sp.]